ncbi:MAG: DNA mismatch repair protein, partial [Leptospiraceae bacterium]|nr:DNA mismatch repair protein [Leptospiraceae bacterium]
SFSNINSKQVKKMFVDFDKIIFRLSFRDAPLANFILNLFFQWDIWTLGKIKKFSEKWKTDLELILNKIEYLDSILPFSNFHFHQKDTQFPTIDPSLKNIQATSLGHPLIPKKQRVNNPLEKVNFSSVVLITGSNMSGKTTYLRSIGVNTLLALCGSPVVAENFTLPPIQILSSIKNEDSLDEGISFFYSEVRKIAYILKTAKSNDIPSLILIDEVLKGTNTRERIIATEKILRELSKPAYRSINFITTHDLELAKGPKAKKWKMKHFVELIEDGKMSFDYKIRDGVVNSSNALRILSLEYPEIVFVDI